MKSPLWFSLIIFAAAVPAAAQIAIGPDDVPMAPGTEFFFYSAYHEDGIEVDLGEAGADRHWDFTNLILPSVDEDELIDPDDANMADEFEDANRVMRSMDSGVGIDIDNGFRYESLTDDGWNLLGVEFPEDMDWDLPIEMDHLELADPVPLLPMPAEFGAEWEHEGSIVMVIEAPDSLAGVFDSVEVTFHYGGVSEIDAWGTLSYPSGEVEVLRQYAYTASRVTAAGVRYIFNRRIVINLGEVHDFGAVHTYKWFAPELGEIISITSVNGEENRNFRLASKIRSRFLNDNAHFTDLTRTEVYHSLIVTGLTFEDEPAPAGWEIGVFTPDGVLAGAEIWRDGDKIGLPAYGDNPDTDETEGFEDGEEFAFQIWDPESEETFEAAAQFEEGPEAWSDYDESTLSLEITGGERELTAPLIDGWNMISINVIPGDEFYREGEERGPDVILMTDQLRIDEDAHRIDLMKDGLGRFYHPGFGFNGIPYWDLASGYQVKANEAAELNYAGEQIPYDADLPLRDGWNMIGYFPNYELDASSPHFYVLSPIIDHVQIAKDGLGRFLNTEFGFSNMPPWREAQGYQVKTDDQVVLNYPEEQAEEFAAARYGSYKENQFSSEAFPPASDRNMSVLVQSIAGADIRAGDQIFAFDGSDNMVGSGEISADGRCGLAVWGDDPATVDKEGLAEGESFTLKIRNSFKNAYSGLHVDYILSGEGFIYRTNDFTAVRLGLNQYVPENHYLAGAFPNPFNAAATIEFGLAEAGRIELGVYNAAGRLIQTLASDFYRAGSHKVQWQASGLAAGTYFVKMETEDFTALRKAVLIK